MSLIGIPITGGFFAKFYVLTAALNSNLVGLTIILVLNSALGAYYYLRIVVMMYMREPRGEVPVALWVSLPRSPLPFASWRLFSWALRRHAYSITQPFPLDSCSVTLPSRPCQHNLLRPHRSSCLPCRLQDKRTRRHRRCHKRIVATTANAHIRLAVS